MLNNSLNWLLSEVIALLGHERNDAGVHEYAVPKDSIVISYRMQDNCPSGLVSANIEGKVDEQGEEVVDEYRPDVFIMIQKVLQKMMDNGY